MLQEYVVLDRRIIETNQFADGKKRAFFFCLLKVVQKCILIK